MSGVHGISTSTYSGDRTGRESAAALLNGRARDKTTKHGQAVEELGYNFRSLIFETVGGALHGQLWDFLTTRAEVIAERSSQSVGLVRSRWNQRLQCIIRAEVAQTIRSRVDRLQNRMYPRADSQQLYDDVCTHPIVRHYYQGD